MNLAMEGGATDGDYQRRLQSGRRADAGALRPGLMIVSAGFDAHERDPLAQMRVTTAGYAMLMNDCADLAAATPRSRS